LCIRDSPYGQQPGPNPYYQQPTHPMPSTGMPQGGGSKKLLVIIASVVAVALVAVTAVFFATRGGDTDDSANKGDKKSGETSGGTEGGGGDEGGGTGGSGPDAMRDVPPTTVPKQDQDAEIAWQAKVPEGFQVDTSMYTTGVWFFGGNVIRYEPDGLRAYNIKSGKEAWFLKAVRGDSCNAAETSGNGGKTLIQWGLKCEKAMGVDLAKGRQLWEKDLPSPDGDVARATTAQVAVSGNLGGIVWIGGNVGYRLSDGKELWSNNRYETCRDYSYGGGEAFVVINRCGFNREGTVRMVDQDGKTTAEWKAPAGNTPQNVYSTSPVIVGLSRAAESSFKISNLAVLSDSMKLRKRISIDPERYTFSCAALSMGHCWNVVVDKESELLFLETKMHQGDRRSTNEIVAYNLDSGKVAWTSEPTVEGQTSPLAMHDGKLLALEMGSFSDPGMLTEVDLRTGKAKPFLRFSSDERDAIRDVYFRPLPYWADNTLFVTSPRLSARPESNRGWLVAIR
ncbi:hypothetical protein GL263_02195, partial [Streptomyces durbertensis]